MIDGTKEVEPNAPWALTEAGSFSLKIVASSQKAVNSSMKASELVNMAAFSAQEVASLFQHGPVHHVMSQHGPVSHLSTLPCVSRMKRVCPRAAGVGV